MKNQIGDNMSQQINIKGGVGPPLAVQWFRLPSQGKGFNPWLGN